MITSITRKLYNELRETFENTPDFLIDFYNRNTVLLNNIKQFNDTEDLSCYSQIMSKYAEAIFFKKRYNETISFVDNKLLIIDNEILRLSAQSVKDDWYYSMISNKAMAHYYLNDFKTATTLFKTLTVHDPKNDMFAKWLAYATYRKKAGLFKILQFTFASLMLVSIVMRRFTALPAIHIPLNFIGLFGLLGLWIYTWSIHRSFKKTLNKLNVYTLCISLFVAKLTFRILATNIY